MDQRSPPCAYRAHRPPVPPMTTPTYSTALYTAAWLHHPDVAYRPLLLGTVAVPTSDHGQTSTAGYCSSPYSELSTLSQIGFTPPGNVARWWVREGIEPHGYASYFQYTYTGPMPCESDCETQDDRGWGDIAMLSTDQLAPDSLVAIQPMIKNKNLVLQFIGFHNYVDFNIFNRSQ